MRLSSGFTLIELTMTILIAAVLASAFVALMIPQTNLFFYLPRQLKTQNTAADLLDVLIEGDDRARGIRYAGLLSAASANTLTYVYTNTDLTSHTIILTYSPAGHTVTRQIDGGSAQSVPYYATAASGILIDASETNFFRFYDAAGASAATLSNIYRIDVAVKVSTGSGKVNESEGNILMKSGVEIKHYA